MGKPYIYKLILIYVVVFFGGCLLSCNEHSPAHSENEEGGHHHEGAVVMEPEKAAGFGVRVETASPGDFAEVIRVSGRIEPAPTDRMTVTARRSGIFTMASGISQGSSVNTGTPIGTISADGVQGGDANAAAKASLDAAKKELDRLTPLYKDGLVTASTFNEAERAYNEAKALAGNQSSPGRSLETAPCSGTLTNILVNSGQYVDVGTPIAIVAKNSRLTLRADVPGRYAAQIPTITTAKFRPDYSGDTYSLSDLDGRLISASGAAETSNGYIPIYFSFMGNGETLPGAFAEIYLIGTGRGNVLTVPKDALIEAQGNKYLYVCEDGHAYEKRLVRTGATDGDQVEITEGLKHGEQYVAEGASIIRMAETSAIAPPGHTHNH